MSNSEQADEGRHVPLGWGQQGDPVQFPAGVAGFRVRRFPPGARGGVPEVVYVDGVPLMLPLNATAEDLREAVAGIGGKYRLEPVDDQCLVIGDAPVAYAVLRGPAGTTGNEQPADALTRVLDTVERLAKANADAMDKVTAQMSAVLDASSRLVSAADSAGVTSRPPPAPIPVQVLAPDSSIDVVPAQVEPSPWKPVLEALAPQAPQIVTGVVTMLLSALGNLGKSFKAAGVEGGGAASGPTNGGGAQ